jgi:hypothetical protein
LKATAKKNVSRVCKKTLHLKFWKTKNSYGICLTEIAGSTQNPEKIIETPNQSVESRNFSKKVCLVLQKWKEAENSNGGYPTEFANSTQNPEQVIGTSNQPR